MQKLFSSLVLAAVLFVNSSSLAASSADPLWESKLSNGWLLTEYVMYKLDSLGKDMLNVVPTDYKTFCPNYKNLSYRERKEFWTYLMSAMVKYESNFQRKMSYREGFTDSNGDPVISRGLLQISIESANSYDCDIDNTSELHSSYTNLSCGIRILNRWVSRDVRIAGKVDSKWRGGARYWSVLRTASDSHNKIVALAKANPICQRY